MYSLIGSGCTQGSTVETYQKTWIQTIQNRDFPQNQRGKNSIAIIEVNCTMAKKKGQGTSNKAAPASVGTTNGKHHINRKNPETRKEEQEERQRILRENEMERQAQLAKYKKAYSGTGDPANFGTQRPPGEHNMPPNGNGGQMMFDTTPPAVDEESEEVDNTNYTHENSIVPAHRPPLSLPDRAPPSVVGHGKTYTVPTGTGGGMDLAAQSLMRMGAGTPKVGQSQPTATINMSMIDCG